MRLPLRRIVPLLGVLSVAACKDDSPPQPAAVVAVSDVALSGAVDETLAPLVVKVTDASGSPVSGIAVTFAVTDGGGTVSPAADTTDFTGRASTRWRLGQRVVAQRVTATVSGVGTPVTFVASTRAGAPAAIAVQGGDNQTAGVGAAVPTAPSVVVRDRFQNVVPGVTVVFSTVSGGGSVTGAGATTDANGVAAVGSWTLGPSVGVNRLSAVALASGVTGNPITFTANGTSGAVAAVTAVGSTSLSGTVGTLVSSVPTVRVTDANGNPIAGASVTFAASSGSTVVGGVKTTAANGTASPDGWQLGAVAQAYTLTATVTGAPPVTFTANASAGAPAIATIVAGNNQTASVGRTLPIDPAIRVTDALNNPVAGLAVTFEVTAGGGAAVARNTVTNASGVATVGAWTLGDQPGVNNLRATVSGTGIAGNPLTFIATATAGAPSSLSIVGGNNQTGVAGSILPVAPSVVVRDSRGNPVSGVTVTFTPNAGSGTVSTANVTTNASGVASATWTLGLTSGTQTLIVSSSGVPSVTFVASATAGTASRVVAVIDSVLPNFPVTNFVSPLPSVRVVDANGNPVSGAEVTFVLDAVGGTGSALTGATRTTGADGVATLGSWRLGTLATTYRIRALVTGLNQSGTEPTFVVTGTALAPTQVVVGTGSSLTPTSTVNTAVAPVPVVQVLDQYSNPVRGVAVTFTVGGAGASTVGAGLSTITVATDTFGFASAGSWTMGAGGGTQRTLTAQIAGTGITGNPLVFTTTPP